MGARVTDRANLYTLSHSRLALVIYQYYNDLPEIETFPGSCITPTIVAIGCGKMVTAVIASISRSMILASVAIFVICCAFLFWWAYAVEYSLTERFLNFRTHAFLLALLGAVDIVVLPILTEILPSVLVDTFFIMCWTPWFAINIAALVQKVKEAEPEVKNLSYPVSTAVKLVIHVTFLFLFICTPIRIATEY